LRKSKKTISSDRKKVADRLTAFCRKNFSERNRSVVKELPKGAIQLYGVDRFGGGELINEIEYYEGSYRAIKARSGDEDENFLSIEYFEVFRENGSLCVNWWYLIDGERIEKFEGAIYFMGEWLWVLLHSPLLGGRFRHICLDGRGWGRSKVELRGGLLLGTSPHATGSVPTTNRLVVERWNNLGSKKEKMLEMGHITPSDLQHPNAQAVLDFMAQGPVVPGRIDADVLSLRKLQSG